MTPTRMLVESTITSNVFNAKACGHMAQAKMLQARNLLANIKGDDDEIKKKDIAFLHAYAQAGEVSAFPIDTDLEKNLAADTDGLKVKVQTAYTRIMEMKVSWDGAAFNLDTKDATPYNDAMKLIDEALGNIEDARQYAEIAVEGTRQAVKHNYTAQDTAAAEA